MRKGSLVVLIVMLAGCGAATSTATSSGGSAVSTGVFKVAPKDGMPSAILSDAEGWTLYTYKPDTAGTPQCNDACASTWPPESAPSTLPSVPAGLTGQFGSVPRSDGTKQLTYDGWPLYRYSKDKAAGDANGQGIQGVWYAVDSATTQNPAPAPTSAPATSAPVATGTPPAATPSPAAASSSSYNYYN